MTAPRRWGAALLAGYVLIRVGLEARYQLFDPDEALEMLAAGSLREGHLPYLGALSHRGPFLTFLYGVPCALFGPYAYHAVHAFAVVLFVALAAWLQRCVARRTRERVGLLTVANLVLLGTVRVPTEDNWSLNSDFLMGALATGAMCLLLARRKGYVGVGLLLSLAFLTKQNAAPFALVPIAWVIFADRSRILMKLGGFAAGFAGPLAVTVCTYAAKGELRRAWYFFFEYNRDYAEAGFTNGPVATMVGDIAWFGRSYGELFVLAAFGAVAFVRVRDSGLGSAWLLAVLWTLAGLVAAALPGKHWDNYLWASHAPVAVLAALGTDGILDWLERGASKRLTFATRATWLGLIAVPVLGTFAQIKRGRAVLTTATEVGGIPPPTVPRREILDVIARVTSPDDAIYVTGYAPELYVLAARRPASRHVISNFVETVYPGRFETPSRLSPRFFAELREDLLASRPRVIVDACSLGFLCHPSSALTAALPLLLSGYHPVAPGPSQLASGIFVRDE